MIKKKKNLCERWTTGIRLVILCALCFNRYFIPDSFPSAKQAEAERRDNSSLSQAAKAGTDQELREELEKNQRQLQQMRLSYAELLIENKDLLEELTQLRLQVANLLGEGRADSAERRQAQVLASMLEMNRQHENLYRQVDEFGDYLQNVLQVMQPSQALRQEIEQRYAELSQSVARLEHLPSIVAWRGGAAIEGRSEARVIRVEEELQIVVLDTGAADRVRPGSVWRIDLGDDAQAPVKVRVMETRSDISAAIPVEGDLSLIAAGMTAERINPE